MNPYARGVDTMAPPTGPAPYGRPYPGPYPGYPYPPTTHPAPGWNHPAPIPGQQARPGAARAMGWWLAGMLAMSVAAGLIFAVGPMSLKPLVSFFPIAMGITAMIFTFRMRVGGGALGRVATARGLIIIMVMVMQGVVWLARHFV